MQDTALRLDKVQEAWIRAKNKAQVLVALQPLVFVRTVVCFAFILFPTYYSACHPRYRPWELTVKSSRSNWTTRLWHWLLLRHRKSLHSGLLS
jgi:hypothetical protein